MSCGCNSPSKTKYCPVNIILENVDPNDPLITGYPTNTLAFIDFARDGDDVVISYDNEFAGNIYRFNGAAWELYFEPVATPDVTAGFMTVQAPFGSTQPTIYLERNLHSFKLQIIIDSDGTVLGDDTIAILDAPFIPANTTLFTAWVYDNAGQNGVQVPGYIDNSGNIVLTGTRIAAPPAAYNIEIEVEYSMTRESI